MKPTTKKATTKPTTKSRAPRLASVERLYGRCIAIRIGNGIDPEEIQVKVLGEREAAAERRDALLAAFAASGITVTERDDDDTSEDDE